MNYSFNDIFVKRAKTLLNQVNHTCFNSSVMAMIPLITVAIILLQVKPKQLHFDAISCQKAHYLSFVNEKLHPMSITLSNRHH